MEQNQAPSQLLASRTDASGTVTETRPLCTFPQVARYLGRGSTNDAANFVCATGSHGDDDPGDN